MTYFYMPEEIDESCDPSADPLCILLAREGSYDEAYQLARQHRAGQDHIVQKMLLQQRPDLDEKGSHDDGVAWVADTAPLRPVVRRIRRAA